MTAYPSPLLTVLDNGPILFPNDYITSPSSVYFSALLSNGQFVVAHGSDLATDGAALSNVAWISSNALPSGTTGIVAGLGAGNFTVTVDPPGNPNPYTFYSTPIPHGPTIFDSFATLSDNGEFAIFQGTPTSPSTKLFSNGINDPVTGISLNSIDYNLAAANANLNTAKVNESASQTCNNTTPTKQVCALTVSHSYTKTQSWNWNLSEALTAGVTATATAQVGLPDVATVSGSVAVNASSTTTISGGEAGSTSLSNSYSDTVNVTTPPYSDYTLLLTAQQATYTVPYMYTGIATYQSGTTAVVTGSGVFDGGDTTDFNDTIACLSYMGGACPAGLDTTLGLGTPVPEPSSLVLVPIALLTITMTRLPALALLAAAAIRGVRPARRRARRRSEPGAVRCYGAGGGKVSSAAAL